MSKLRVNGFAISIDGFGAGPKQNINNPLGVGGQMLHKWIYPTKTFKSMFGQEGGTTGVDDGFARRGMENVGAWILGRNMFSPMRGPWQGDEWKGWWGDNPPYHVPTFVLTHHARKPIEMKGGTTFHFVTGGIEDALKRAKDAAGSKDIRLGGGVETIRQYLKARLVDELHLVISPILLGTGENLLHGINMTELGYQSEEPVAGDAGMHVTIKREKSGAGDRI